MSEQKDFDLSAVADLIAACEAVVGLIGNVVHSQGNGPNSVKMRGEKLNDIRAILVVALAKVKGPSE